MCTAIISVKPSSLFITFPHPSAKPHQQFVKATFFYLSGVRSRKMKNDHLPTDKHEQNGIG